MSQAERQDSADVAENADNAVIGRLIESARSARRDVARGLRRLDAVEGRNRLAGHSADGRTAKAVMSLIANFGDTQRTDRVGIAGDDLSDVQRVSRRLGAASRFVVLTDRWWLHDQGLLVGALRGENDGDADTVVALRWRTTGGYAICDPDTGERVAVTVSNANRLKPFAYAIYPGLPQKVRGLPALARFLWPAVQPDLWRLILASAAIGIAGLLLPITTGIIIDELIPGHQVPLLFQFGAGLAIAALLTFLVTIFTDLVLLRMNGRSALMLQGAVWNRVLCLPATFFKSYASGDLSQRISGVEALRSVVLEVMLSASVTVFFSVFYLGLLFYYDPRLAAAALVLVVVLALAILTAGLLQIGYHRRQVVLSGWLSGYVFEVLQGIVKLRVAGAERRAFARWAGRFAEERAAIVATRRIDSYFQAFSDAYSVLSLAALFAVAGFLSGFDLTAGSLIAFLAAFGVFQGSFLSLSEAVLKYVAVKPDFDRAKPFLEAAPEYTPASADPGTLRGAIEISNLTFAYSAGATPVLKNVSLAIKPGEHVAIVGPSGSGKSTLFRVLLGFEKPMTGTVLYDDQDLGSLDLAAVRRQIGVVLQTGRLFAGTIFENIQGASNATIEDCLQACEAAGFADDLARFPMGIHTVLTEGAATISGGQRQRLLIARALVSKPKILLMDEATSALDNRTQEIVTESLDRLAVTRVVIAHRLSTVRDAGVIVVMEKGTIVEKGNFEELTAKGGLFSKLASRQLS